MIIHKKLVTRIKNKIQ